VRSITVPVAPPVVPIETGRRSMTPVARKCAKSSSQTSFDWVSIQ